MLTVPERPLSEVEVRAAFEGHGLLQLSFEEAPEPRWWLSFGSHEEAQAAVADVTAVANSEQDSAAAARLRGARCATAFNDRVYDERGWVCGRHS